MKKYGWIPDLPDSRDLLLLSPKQFVCPPSIDLRKDGALPPVYDQNQIGSCTANAIAAAIEYDQNIQHLPSFMPSRLFIYYNERAMEGTIGSDSGAQIRDGVKSIAKLGACTENIWPYSKPFTQKPPQACYVAALQHRAVQYMRIVPTLDLLKSSLAHYFPFVFGFTVYEDFESSRVAKTGMVNMPKKGERSLGGHAVMCVGYDDKKQRFIVRNSWGTGWGIAGYFTMPYSYLTDSNLSDDFWQITVVK